jgi:hypothetical protein
MTILFPQKKAEKHHTSVLFTGCFPLFNLPMYTNTEFQQVGFNLDRFKFVVEETGVRVIQKRISSSTDIFIDFEDVGSKIIFEQSRKLGWFIVSFLFFSFGIGVFIKRLNGGDVGSGAEVFHLSVSVVCFAIFLFTKKNILYLAQADSTGAIEFIATKKYKEKVNAFIESLLQKRNIYLLEKYATIDQFVPYGQQYNALVWLYNQKLLTKEQLQEKVLELNKVDFESTQIQNGGVAKIIGFRSNAHKESDTIISGE